MNAAEAAIIRDGLAAMTIRGLTRAAEVNIASVNYFFGTKDGLLSALHERMLRPMNADRLARFTALEAAGPVDVVAAVRALLEPLEQMRQRHGRAAVELYRYLLTRPDPRLHVAGWEVLQSGYRRFEDLVLLALPDRPQEPLRQRVRLVCDYSVPVVLGVPLVVTPPTDELDLDELVAFLSAGLEAPVTVG